MLSRFAVFSLSQIALCIHLGFVLSDRLEVMHFQFDRDRKTWMEPMSPGSTHDIDGHHAHRVVNTGDEPLIFLVSWMSDCGHDYQSIKAEGFGKRVVKGPDGPQLV